MTDTSYSISDDSLAKYFPERNYEERDYKPYGKPYKDLCGHCSEYYKFIYEKGLKKTSDVPKCLGHITKQFDFISKDDFEEEEYTDFVIASDPVTWAYHMFGWKARWHQEEMMSCTSIKKVVRAGRRSGKTLAVAILSLWRLATMSNESILIIAPFEVQVQKIFDEMLEFIAMSPALSASIKRSTRSPCRLDFNNGSKALGFSSGNHNTAGSDKIRGQDATYIVIDECDYINEQDIEAILAILASHPDCGLWMSSTPTGQHKKFYQYCVMKDLGFKEFWYTSNESPTWTEETEDFYRQTYSATNYEHEFLAQFGIQEAGVFRNDLIDRALLNYSLPRQRTHGSRISIGADWNGQAIGTHIVVVEAVVDMEDNLKYILLEKCVVRGEDFTQHEAVQKIIELNDKYNPACIYVDAGFGETQVEMLHKYGMENKRSGLHKKLKPYTMQSNIEITDPVTGIKIKKSAKPFMVNMSVMQLEQDRVVLPISEDTSIVAATMEGEESNSSQGLVQQMRNFAIERISSNGLPTYSQGEDHTLTAWMLAITGFILEFSDLRRRSSHVVSRFVGQPGESIHESENHALVRVAESIRQLDKGVKLPKYNNLGSLEKAIKQGEKLREAFEAGQKPVMSKYFRKDKGFRKSDLGSPKTQGFNRKSGRRTGGTRRMF